MPVAGGARPCVTLKVVALSRDTVVEPIRAELAKCPGVRLALLFGSVARGDVWTESDVDLAVLADEVDLAELGQTLERALGTRVDIVALSADLSMALLQQLLRDGICIYEAHEGAHAA